LGNLIRFVLLPGQRHDTVGVAPLIQGVEFDAFVADKAFDANWIVDELNERGAKVVISQMPQRKAPLDIDREVYKWRHLIEEIFRSLKADGMRLEDTQVQDAGRLFKLALVGLAAATRTMQLVDARDGSPRPATDVVDASVLPAAEAIAPTLEGKTARQQNPHPLHSLAWLSWIIARLGGWNCYYKPPGPKTMRAGWIQFAAMAAGFTLTAQSNV